VSWLLSSVDTFRAVQKRNTISVTEILHSAEESTASRVIRRYKPAEYRVCVKGMNGTFSAHEYLKRVGLARTQDCPNCDEGISETLIHFSESASALDL
jgi:hypothetical protein